MICVRATKYNPLNRNKQGVYAVEEWTSVSDIGKAFVGNALTVTEYLSAEDRYITSIRHFLAAADVSVLTVKDLEQHNTVRSTPLKDTKVLLHKVSHIEEGDCAIGESIDYLARLALREAVWCRLEGKDNTYIHFGYDYYMYFGTAAPNASLPDAPAGMFYEAIESPYSQG